MIELNQTVQTVGHHSKYDVVEFIEPLLPVWMEVNGVFSHWVSSTVMEMMSGLNNVQKRPTEMVMP
jgi:hypothetical protein